MQISEYLHIHNVASLKLHTLVWSSYMHSDLSYTINSLKAKSLFPIRTIEMLHKTNSKYFLKFNSMFCAYFTNLLFTEQSEKTEKRKKKKTCRLVHLSLSFYIINFNRSWLMKGSNKRQYHIFFYLFILFTGFSRQEYWGVLSFPSPVDHILSELSTMTHPSWVALHGMAHSFIELDKLWAMWSVWLVFCDYGFHSVCPLPDKSKRLIETSWWERLTGGTWSCSDGWGHAHFSLVQFGEGNGNPLQYLCPENPMDRAAGMLQSMGSQRVGQDWATSLSLSLLLTN